MYIFSFCNKRKTLKRGTNCIEQGDRIRLGPHYLAGKRRPKSPKNSIESKNVEL